MLTLKTKKLSVSIGQKTICQYLDLEIKPGEIWGILGQNGSGKTTLLHTLAGLYSPTQGDIYLGENNIHSLATKTLAQYRGILLQQEQPTFSQTVWEYCLAARYPYLPLFATATSADKYIVRQALQTVELETLTEHKTHQLSGGEKRRMELAALLAQTPFFYFLDEPTNHLDLRHQILILQHLVFLAAEKSKSIVISLHDINLVQQFCQHVILLFPGGDVLWGETRQLLTEKNLSQLYQHPILSLSQANNLFWRAKTES